MSVTAQIRWLKPDEGGRQHPPSGPQYSTVARFESQTEEEWKIDAWSVILEFQQPPDESGCHIVQVRFLSPSGPSHWLELSRRFTLYEGKRRVAEGIVLFDSGPDGAYET